MLSQLKDSGFFKVNWPQEARGSTDLIGRVRDDAEENFASVHSGIEVEALVVEGIIDADRLDVGAYDGDSGDVVEVGVVRAESRR